MKCCVCYADFIRPFLYGLRFAIKGDVDSGAAIVSLLFGCRPFAVFGGVRAVIVNAIDGVTRPWALPHISMELLK